LPQNPSLIPLGVYPTPLHPLPRLTAQLGGAQLWIKRDDLTGFAPGGNKVRSLRPPRDRRLLAHGRRHVGRARSRLMSPGPRARARHAGGADARGRAGGAAARAALLGGALALAGLAGTPAPVQAWPAIQDATGTVYLCDGRPTGLPDGRWSRRSGGGVPTGALVDVVRPGVPPGGRLGPPPAPPYRYGFHPWARPPGDPSGYDALDPWLGNGPSER
jgi:hypothetical protein